MIQLINAFLVDLQRQGYTPNTIRAYHYALSKISDYSLPDLNTDDLQSLFADSRVSTAAARISAIKSFFGWLQNNNIIAYNPAANLQREIAEAVPVSIIPPQDLTIIFARVSELPLNLQAFFCLLRDSGLRTSEGLTLKVVDISPGFVRLPDRSVPISPQCNKLLQRLSRQQSDYLFVTRLNCPPSYHWAYRYWRDIMLQTGMDYTLHQLRLTCIANWIGSGIDPAVARRMAGVTKIKGGIL